MSKVKKVTVTKEVAKAIEGLLNSPMWGKPEDILQFHSTQEWSNDGRQCLNALSIQYMANILFGGYEVENPVTLPELKEISKSKVDQLVDDYQKQQGSKLFSYGDGLKDGIDHTLSRLGIKVKGINA